MTEWDELKLLMKSVDIYTYQIYLIETECEFGYKDNSSHYQINIPFLKETDKLIHYTDYVANTLKQLLEKIVKHLEKAASNQESLMIKNNRTLDVLNDQLSKIKTQLCVEDKE